MKRAILIISCILITVLATFTVLQQLRGSVVKQFDEQSQSCSVSTSAPFFPFRSGNLEILVEGNFPEGAQLTVFSKKGIWNQTYDLAPNQRVFSVREAEAWIDTASATIRPLGESSFTVKIGLYCGTLAHKRDSEWLKSIRKIESEQDMTGQPEEH